MVMRDRCGKLEGTGKLLLELPVSRKDLAAMLGVRRESVSRMLQKLEKEGITHTANRHFEVEAPNKLFSEILH
jgi:CRP/FNR family transcriptional regulator